MNGMNQYTDEVIAVRCQGYRALGFPIVINMDFHMQ